MSFNAYVIKFLMFNLINEEIPEDININHPINCFRL
jgi:hypothetical protein